MSKYSKLTREELEDLMDQRDAEHGHVVQEYDKVIRELLMLRNGRRFQAACAALQGLLAHPSQSYAKAVKPAGEDAVAYADALLKELGK